MQYNKLLQVAKKNKLLEILSHGIGLWFVLVMVYNIYKHLLIKYCLGFFPTELKTIIKLSFVINPLLFVFLLWLLLHLNKKCAVSTFTRYTSIFMIHALLVNLIFFFLKGNKPVILIINLGEFIFAFFLFVVNRNKVYLKSLLNKSGVYLESLQKYFIIEKSADSIVKSLVILFMVILTVSAVMLLSDNNVIADRLSEVAYLVLAMGLIVGCYQTITGK